MSAFEVFSGLNCSDNASGVAVLYRKGGEIARVDCTMLPQSWFERLQEYAEVGDMVEVTLGAPLNRQERFYMSTANHNGFVTGFCTDVIWNWKPAREAMTAHAHRKRTAR